MKNRDKTIREDEAKTDRSHAGGKPERPRPPNVRDDEVLGTGHEPPGGGTTGGKQSR
jgi:hypothetical protein